MRWYVLATVTTYQSRVCELLQSEGLPAFLPKIENYRSDRREIEEKILYPGYVFVKDRIGKEEFYQKLLKTREKSGIIRFWDLGRDCVSALTEGEQELFENLLDEDGVLRISHAFLRNKKAVVVEGPLVKYQDLICKVDKHAGIAYLELKFLGKRIQAGLLMDATPVKEERREEVLLEADGVEINLEELKRQMMGL